MANGLRYETGRDMPPGMAEKVAVQIARQMETAAPAEKPTPLPVAGIETELSPVDRLISTGWLYERALNAHRRGELDDESLNDIINLIDAAAEDAPMAPTAQKWVPVAERKPDQELKEWRKHQESAPLTVLVMIAGAIEAATLFYDEDGDFFSIDEAGDVDTYKVVCWMPMPVPPQEGTK